MKDGGCLCPLCAALASCHWVKPSAEALLEGPGEGGKEDARRKK
jgi:hypothetical protein